MTRSRRIALSSLGIAPTVTLGVVVAIAAILLIAGRLQPFEVAACITRSGPPPTQPLPPIPDWWRWALLGSCVVAFALGHATSHVRSGLEQGRRYHSARARQGSRTVQGMMIAFLGVGVLLSAYEVVSVVPAVSTPSSWPLSYYVRCTNVVAPYQTLAGTAVVAFLLGHWFCHPGRRPEADVPDGR